MYSMDKGVKVDEGWCKTAAKTTAVVPPKRDRGVRADGVKQEEEEEESDDTDVEDDTVEDDDDTVEVEDDNDDNVETGKRHEPGRAR